MKRLKEFLGGPGGKAPAAAPTGKKAAGTLAPHPLSLAQTATSPPHSDPSPPASDKSDTTPPPPAVDTLLGNPLHDAPAADEIGKAPVHPRQAHGEALAAAIAAASLAHGGKGTAVAEGTPVAPLATQVQLIDDDGAGSETGEAAPCASSSSSSCSSKSSSGSGKVSPSGERRQQFPAFRAPIKAVPSYLRKQQFDALKHNSTSSIYVTNTITEPNVEELVRCMSHAFLYHVAKSPELPDRKVLDIFNEQYHPLGYQVDSTKTVPTVESVFNFLMPIIKNQKLGAEVCIMCLAYVERVLELSKIAITPYTWRRTILGALVLASKVWEDQSVWNIDFVQCFSCVTAADLNDLERTFLNLIEFNVGLKASLYASYFFSLEQYASNERQELVKPLDKSAAERLEIMTFGKQKDLKASQNLRRTNSADDLSRIKSAASRAVIS